MKDFWALKRNPSVSVIPQESHAQKCEGVGGITFHSRKKKKAEYMPLGKSQLWVVTRDSRADPEAEAKPPDSEGHFTIQRTSWGWSGV